jgi:hypothetical protein
MYLINLCLLFNLYKLLITKISFTILLYHSWTIFLTIQYNLRNSSPSPMISIELLYFRGCLNSCFHFKIPFTSILLHTEEACKFHGCFMFDDLEVLGTKKDVELFFWKLCLFFGCAGHTKESFELQDYLSFPLLKFQALNVMNKALFLELWKFSRVRLHRALSII